MTETSSVTHLVPRHDMPDMLASVGIPIPNTECRIVDVSTKSDTELETVGELWVRGPQVMKGYIDDPETTRNMIDDAGWLHTGDVAYMDKAGRLFILDRVRELTKFRSLQYGETELFQSMIEVLDNRRQTAKHLAFQSRLLDSVRESVIAMDLDLRITFWNRGAETLYGYTAQEAIGCDVRSLIIPHERADIALNQEHVRAGKWQLVERRRRKDGKILWSDIVASTVNDSDGQPSGIIAIHRDVTELLQNQAALGQSRQQLRDLASRLMEVREQERTALSRELHDELGQLLTRLKIDICWLVDALPARRRTKRVDAIVPMVDKILDTVRHISSELRPAILDDLGLGPAIEWQGQEFTEWNRCPCTVDVRLDDLKPDPTRDTAVFRIVQEALTNIARHAQARSAHIAGSVDDGTLTIEIHDDGIGFSESEIGSSQSLGVIGMRERAKVAGGSIDLRRSTFGGTIVRIQVPGTESISR